MKLRQAIYLVINFVRNSCLCKSIHSFVELQSAICIYYRCSLQAYMREHGIDARQKRTQEARVSSCLGTVTMQFQNDN